MCDNNKIFVTVATVYYSPRAWIFYCSWNSFFLDMWGAILWTAQNQYEQQVDLDTVQIKSGYFQAYHNTDPYRPPPPTWSISVIQAVFKPKNRGNSKKMVGKMKAKAWIYEWSFIKSMIQFCV